MKPPSVQGFFPALLHASQTTAMHRCIPQNNPLSVALCHVAVQSYKVASYRRCYACSSTIVGIVIIFSNALQSGLDQQEKLFTCSCKSGKHYCKNSASETLVFQLSKQIWTAA